MRCFVLCLAALVAVCSLASPALAWGNSGHELTAQVAVSLLTSDAASEASRILGGASLESVATWADKVKHESEFKWSEPLHFVNTPSWACKYATSDCPDNVCVVGAIFNYTKRAVSQTGEQQDEALKFLIHFAGDAHQPLHVAFSADHGGNYIEGDFYGDSTNLHAVWDFGIIDQRLKDDFNNDQSSYGEYLIDLIQPGGNLSTNATEWAKCQGGFPCPNEWAMGTAELACSKAYTEADGTHVPNHFDLGSDYYYWTYETVDVQLAKGGVRLASVLNQILTESARAHKARTVDMSHHNNNE